MRTDINIIYLSHVSLFSEEYLSTVIKYCNVGSVGFFERNKIFKIYSLYCVCFSSADFTKNK